MTYLFYTSSSHIPLQLVFQSYTFLSNIYEQLKLLNSIVTTQNLHVYFKAFMVPSTWDKKTKKNPKKQKNNRCRYLPPYHIINCPIYLFLQTYIRQTWTANYANLRANRHIQAWLSTRSYFMPYQGLCFSSKYLLCLKCVDPFISRFKYGKTFMNTGFY